MSSIANAIAALSDDFKAADELVDEIYTKYFDTYFHKETELCQKFRVEDVSISDKELEWILISLPLDIKMASSSLAQFKQHNEIVKLKIKQRKGKTKDTSETETEDNLDEELKLMSIIYTSVITRVEMDIAFSKELIMGAKKVWDARRRSEDAPVGEIPPELPDYPMESEIGSNNKVDF